MTHPAIPLVTIGIPTFNRADAYLKLALESALSQTYSNIEIIVADNCSIDETDRIVEQQNDSRIRYFRHPHNIGPNNNFNFCLDEARGQYFLLLHDDDVIDQDFIETCMKAAEALDSPGIIRTGTRLIDHSGRVLKEKKNRVTGLTFDEFLLGWFDGKTSLYLCSTIFNTKKLIGIGGFSSKKNLFQDVVAEVLLASKYGRIDVADVKSSFRKHPGEITFGVDVKDWCEDSFYLLETISKLDLEKRREVLTKGKKFLRKINLNRAAAVINTVDRLKSYLVVYKMFGFDVDTLYGLLSKAIIKSKRVFSRGS